MGKTLAIMVTATTKGTWVRGDRRGWVDDGVICPADPVIEAADLARMKHPPFFFDPMRLVDVAQMMCVSLIERLSLTILAITVQTWHAHFVIGATSMEIGDVVKCAKEAARYGLRPGRPIWTEDYDKRFCFDRPTTIGRVRYVERHNEQCGLGAVPDQVRRFITPLDAYFATLHI